MIEPIDRQPGPTSSLTRAIRELFNRERGPRVVLRFWDGTEIAPASGPRPSGVVAFRRPSALCNLMLRPSSLTAGEAYVRGDLEVEGDLEAVLAELEAFQSQKLSWRERATVAAGAFRLLGNVQAALSAEHEAARLGGAPDSRARCRQAIGYHYDLPVEFWQAWLDSHLQYTCAYYRTDADDIQTAQQQKLDHVCRKLRIQSGSRMLDIGCGWGGLALWAARRYGASVVGITLSSGQADYVREAVARAGLTKQVSVALCDFRDFTSDVPFDCISGVGIIEHLGPTRQRDYFSQAARLLRPGGLFLNHGLARATTAQITSGPSFLSRYVFPDACLTPLHHSIEIAEECGLELRDVENLREHYYRTLQHWLQRLEARSETVRSITSEETHRVFRLYLTGFAHQFRQARVGLYQSLFLKPTPGTLTPPETRAALYE